MTGAGWTVPRFRAAKGKRKLACVTAFDYGSARLAAAAGIPLLLVGDSLAMTVLGHDTTLPVTLDEMLHHTRPVVRGAGDALVVADMPFLSYQAGLDEAVASAGRFLKEAGAHAVKIEGGAFRAPVVEHLLRNGIPVMGHIGLLPQNVQAMGGYKVQGRSAEQAEGLLADAKALGAAGVFALVLEGIPSDLAGRITASVSVPTIGIGAGPQCDGQILVWHDLLGLNEDFTPKFVKRFAELAPAIRSALETYRSEVEQGTFPGPEHGYRA